MWTAGGETISHIAHPSVTLPGAMFTQTLKTIILHTFVGMAHYVILNISHRVYTFFTILRVGSYLSPYL